jgi:hypothetical protein
VLDAEDQLLSQLWMFLKLWLTAAQAMSQTKSVVLRSNGRSTSLASCSSQSRSCSLSANRLRWYRICMKSFSAQINQFRASQPPLLRLVLTFHIFW